jgi:hypothetical protein
MSYERFSARVQIADPMLPFDTPRINDAADTISLVPDSIFDLSSEPVDSQMATPMHNLSDAGDPSDMAPTNLHADVAVGIAHADISAVSLAVAMPSIASRPSREIRDQRNGSMDLAMQQEPPTMFAGGFAPDVPLAVDPASLTPGIVAEVQLDFATFAPLARGPAGFREPLSHPVDQVVASTNDSDAVLSVESTVPPAKIRSPNPSGTYDAGPSADQVAAVGTSVSASSGMANPPAINMVLYDGPISNSIEGGFITLSDTLTNVPPIRTSPTPSVEFYGGGDADPGQTSWFADILPNPRKPADVGGRSVDYGSRGNRVADIPSHPASPISLLVVAAEGGGIEFAIAPQSLTAAGDDLQFVAEPGESTADQQFCDIRPESGVGLFCDIEVSVASSSPIGAAASAVNYYLDPASRMVDSGLSERKAGYSAEVPPLIIKPSKATTAGPSDPLPLLLGSAILVSAGGLRLEEEAFQRERRLRGIRDYLQSSRR